MAFAYADRACQEGVLALREIGSYLPQFLLSADQKNRHSSLSAGIGHFRQAWMTRGIKNSLKGVREL
jgi:hypothetical protein